ncbi:hypothetical protein [Shewanella baltica]|uniref:hypothetical protein n=1 Tax=Shewanella baltica TaxID=62322 RepID=UPI00217E2834|nr:hypothetical protein [Shewanella baltica]MCS6095026.1 hypothetical protein [Shewanella baltica]MCS6226134.1 hypothetical protein [Shewanella baltica]
MIFPRFTIRLSQEGFLFKSLLLIFTFCYLFQLKFLSFEWIPATRLVFLLCTFTVGIKLLYFFKKEIEKNIIFYLIQCSIFLYIISQVILLPTDFGMLSKIIVFLVFTLYMAAAASMYFFDVRHLLKILTVCCSIQAVMVFVSFLVPAYRDWLSTIMVEGGNIPFSDPFRVPGFSPGSGASLALTISAGVFSSMALYWQSEKLKPKLVYLFLSILMSVSCIFVGKLGLFLSLFYILTFFVLSFNNLKHTVFIFFVTVVILFLIYLSLDVDWDAIAYPLQRSFSIFLNGEDSSVGALGEMPIPPLDITTIIGTGLASTPNGLNASGSDIGYIQTYFGFGLIISIFFYASFFVYLVNNIFKLPNSKNKLLCLIFFAPLFIIELKEPFVTKIIYPLILLVLIFLSQKELGIKDA